MRVGRAIGVGFDAADRLVRLSSATEALTTVRERRHVRSSHDPGPLGLHAGPGQQGFAGGNERDTDHVERERLGGAPDSYMRAFRG